MASIGNLLTSAGVFRALFCEAANRAGLSHAAFARMIGVTPPYISQVLSEMRPPPLDSIEHWADVLHLAGERRERFLTEAHLAHCPPVIATGWRNLEARVAELEAQQRPLAADQRANYDPA